MQLPDESNSKRQISNEKHIAYRIGLQEISKVIQDYLENIKESIIEKFINYFFPFKGYISINN